MASRSPSATPRRSITPRSASRSRSPSRSPSKSRSGSPARRSRSPAQRSPPPPRSSKIVVEKLTKNVNEAHLRDIFGAYGELREIDLPMNRQCRWNQRRVDMSSPNIYSSHDEPGNGLHTLPGHSRCRSSHFTYARSTNRRRSNQCLDCPPTSKVLSLAAALAPCASSQ